MSMDQIALTWSLLLLQGTRRLAESYAITKFSASRMWFVHWYLGVTFYLAIGVAVWIEGTGMASQFTSGPKTADPSSRHPLTHHLILERDQLCRTVFANPSRHPALLACLGRPARLPRLSRLSAEIHAPRPSTVPGRGVPALCRRMRHLCLAGFDSCSAGRLGESDAVLCVSLCGRESGSDG